MRIVEPKVEIIPQGEGLTGIFRQIEICGRTCYKSEIKEAGAEPFVRRMIKNEHFAMLEHGTVYLHVNFDSDFIGQSEMVNRYNANPYSKVIKKGDDYYITTNYRVIVENGWYYDMDYRCEPTEWHEKRVTAKFYTQIAVSREANRHRVDSIAEQSTRYCNYSKDKFGHELSVSKPQWIGDNINDEENNESVFYSMMSSFLDYRKWNPVQKWWFANKVCEKMYMSMIEEDGALPQEARAILPLDTSTELVHTAFVSDWKHFFDLRFKGTTGNPHPDIKCLAKELFSIFLEEGLIEK